ncbi:aldo/keto reductase [Lutimaribacter marinistellae]|uniref:Aldo/keto reductase n=1 Tax=Lutimaribacter marinistellae TaxID=1820329 RepID=A0ABV7TGX3_9RHOB
METMNTPLLDAPDGTPVSRFAFGTMQFGGRADALQSEAMYNNARAAGITHFDTAYVYTDGASEEMLGRMIAAEREQLLIATKVGYSGGAGAANLRAQFEQSRKRLDLDMVDVLYLHRFDPDTELGETMDFFAEARMAGQIRYVGLSNFAAWQAMKAQAEAQARGFQIAIMQPMYNLVKRQAEVEILPMCADQGIAVAPYSPLGGGLLTGKYAKGGAGRLSEDDRYATRYGEQWMKEAARGLAQMAEELDTDPATLAVAWVASAPWRPTPIVSARSAEQLAPSLSALDFEMSDDLRARISALGRTPPPATDRLEEGS